MSEKPDDLSMTSWGDGPRPWDDDSLHWVAGAECADDGQSVEMWAGNYVDLGARLSLAELERVHEWTGQAIAWMRAVRSSGDD